MTVLTLFVLLGADFATGRAIHQLGDAPTPIKIGIIAHQWWWEASYFDWPDRFGDRMPSNIITTAGDLHVPVDPDHPVVVQLDLESHDVIHSFWAPNLHGKKDLVTGHPTSIWIRADRPGTYWGECADALRCDFRAGGEVSGLAGAAASARGGAGHPDADAWPRGVFA